MMRMQTRRNFIQSVLAGLAAVGIPFTRRAEAEVDLVKTINGVAPDTAGDFKLVGPYELESTDFTPIDDDWLEWEIVKDFSDPLDGSFGGTFMSDEKQEARLWVDKLTFAVRGASIQYGQAVRIWQHRTSKLRRYEFGKRQGRLTLKHMTGRTEGVVGCSGNATIGFEFSQRKFHFKGLHLIASGPEVSVDSVSSVQDAVFTFDGVRCDDANEDLFGKQTRPWVGEFNPERTVTIFG
jgi:hypothetical protein